MKITVELVQSWEPCEDYPEERLRELLGDGLAPLEVAEVDIPVDDRIWALLRREVLGARPAEAPPDGPLYDSVEYSVESGA